MAYQSVHTGPEVDAAVSVLSDVQDIRDQVAADKATVTTLAGQTATNAGLAQTAATNAQADAASALTSKNDAHTSAQTAGAHAANADSARALAVVARNGAEQAEDSAWEAEGEVRYLLSDSEATIDSIRAEILRQKYGAGPYPSLDIGMVGANVLDRRVTFTRVSDATYWDSLGALQTAGPNEPRFDYDPETGECLGLLVEGPATNLLSRSEEFENPVWLSTSLSVSANVATAPDGNLTADKLIEGADNSIHRTRRDGTTVTSGADYTFSVFLKAAERSKVRFSFSSTVFSGAAAGFDLAAGTSSADFGTPAHSIIPVGNGWFRCVVTVRAGESGLAGFSPSILLLNNSGSQTYAGDGVSGVYIWGAQFEQGSAPTSYIKTEASQVTRAADLAVIDDLSWYNPEGGTLYAEGFAPTTPGVNIRTLVSLDNSTSAERIQLRKIPERAASAVMVHGGVVQANLSEGSNDWASSSSRKLAISFSVNGMAFSVDGKEPIFAGPVSLPEPTRLAIGSGSAVGDARLNGYIKRIAYFPRALPDAKLVELTTS